MFNTFVAQPTVVFLCTKYCSSISTAVTSDPFFKSLVPIIIKPPILHSELGKSCTYEKFGSSPVSWTEPFDLVVPWNSRPACLLVLYSYRHLTKNLYDILRSAEQNVHRGWVMDRSLVISFSSNFYVNNQMAIGRVHWHDQWFQQCNNTFNILINRFC